VKGHQQAGNTPCLKCHDPHTGKEKYLLKGEALKTALAPAVPLSK
jgi:predicted CXXCH cytochrome family protein